MDYCKTLCSELSWQCLLIVGSSANLSYDLLLCDRTSHMKREGIFSSLILWIFRNGTCKAIFNCFPLRFNHHFYFRRRSHQATALSQSPVWGLVDAVQVIAAGAANARMIWILTFTAGAGYRRWGVPIGRPHDCISSLWNTISSAWGDVTDFPCNCTW